MGSVISTIVEKSAVVRENNFLRVIDQVVMYSTANSTHSTMTTVAKCVYDDFSAPTPFRSARVIVEGKKACNPTTALS